MIAQQCIIHAVCVLCMEHDVPYTTHRQHVWRQHTPHGVGTYTTWCGLCILHAMLLALQKNVIKLLQISPIWYCNVRWCHSARQSGSWHHLHWSLQYVECKGRFNLKLWQCTLDYHSFITRENRGALPMRHWEWPWMEPCHDNLWDVSYHDDNTLWWKRCHASHPCHPIIPLIDDTVTICYL